MASAALIAATPAEEKQPHSEESDDDEEPEAEEKAASSSPPQQADDNDDDGDDDDDDDDGTSFTTLLFSDRGTRLPHWTVETDESFNESLGNRALLPTWKPEYQPTVKQLQPSSSCRWSLTTTARASSPTHSRPISSSSAGCRISKTSTMTMRNLRKERRCRTLSATWSTSATRRAACQPSATAS
jgi:hypothetical protein